MYRVAIRVESSVECDDTHTHYSLLVVHALLPPCVLFACPRCPLVNSALEELRAAHNLVSDVPSSLGKNVALRTLDLGHNNIESWNGLERVGKNLTSLVQLTLAGNPLCGSASAGTRAFSPGCCRGSEDCSFGVESIGVGIKSSLFFSSRKKGD